MLSVQETADWLGVHPKTLQNYRIRGGGPAYTKIGTRVCYRMSAVDAFVAANTFRHTAEEATRG